MFNIHLIVAPFLVYNPRVTNYYMYKDKILLVVRDMRIIFSCLVEQETEESLFILHDTRYTLYSVLLLCYYVIYLFLSRMFLLANAITNYF